MSSAGVQKRGSATTVRACDSCRKRKRRCLWDQDTTKCTYCTQLKEECTTTYVRKQRSKPQGKERLAEYERRIKNLESLLQERSEAQPHVQSQPLQPLLPDDAMSLEMWVDHLRTEVDNFPAVAPELDHEIYTGPFHMTGSVSSKSGIGESLASNDMSEEPSLDSLDDFEPSKDFEEDAALLQDPLFQSLENLDLENEIIVPTKSASCMAMLPPPELGASLLAEFLVDFNAVYALYRPREIVQHMWICYAGLSDGSALAWASAYVVLGIAHRARGMSNVATPLDNELSDRYLVKIMPTLSGLLASPPTLGLVQCLLGLGVLMRSSSFSHQGGNFIATALRMAQFLAYDDGDLQGIETADYVEQKRRVFWCAFMLDTEESIFLSAPTTHRKEDLSEAFPEENPRDLLGSVTAAEGNWKVDLFALRIRLALIQSEVIERVFSVRARGTDTQAAAQDVLKRLESWHDNDLFHLEPGELRQQLYLSDLMHVLTVEASYFATVFRIHAFLSLGKNPLINPFSADALAMIAERKEQGSFKEAERLLAHLTLIPHGDIGVCWMIKLPVIAAFTTVLSHHLHSPGDKLNADILSEYSRILNTLGILAEKSRDLQLLRGRDACLVLFAKVEKGSRMKEIEGQGGVGGT